MLEETFPPLPPSPASPIRHLDAQFACLHMSSDMPSGISGAHSPVASVTIAPLAAGPRQALIKHFESFGNVLSSVTDSATFVHECHIFDKSIEVRFLLLSILPCSYLSLVIQDWHAANGHSFEALQHQFAEHVDLQNMFFDMLRKYDAVAFGDRQLFPKFWEKSGKPSALVFMCEMLNHIKALHAARKHQQSLAPTVIYEMPKEVPKEVPGKEGKGKKVCSSLLFQPLVNALIQSKVLVPFPTFPSCRPDHVSDVSSSLKRPSSPLSLLRTVNQARISVAELFLSHANEDTKILVMIQ